MATTNDTDPQREQPFHDDTSRTEPGAPPPTDDAAADAASLLAGLESAQPTPSAAAYAVPPRRPPRPNEKTVENPGVFINATVPLPQAPPSSGHQKLGPPDPPVVSMKGDPTVLGGARLFEALQNQTNPGERARNQLRIYFAAIAGVVVAALIAVAIMMTARASNNTATSSPTPSASASSAPTAISTQPIATAATSTPTVTSPTPTATPTVTTKPTTHGRPHGSSPAPRPSGNFAEPDRHL
jgi:hypothetical protein